ncbi:excisionase family DNA-binding protein [Tumebacillus sp. DT12]|uniref:Excisionase family DNA-binding protein n=1 Tax=Tumebacillus lacus TaxID=2995335 RepID=A0ABT3X255_9BACL|nr:excisionase family DNA-binding protein [Tumebacillus lacus]MCX7570995.1 excisionase family DNA-binding protein [Tumebacillus lacus]
MSGLDTHDFEKVSEAVSMHLRDGQVEISLSLVRTMRALLQTGKMAHDLAKIFEKLSRDVKDTLLCKHQELNEKEYHEMLDLFEETVAMSVYKPANDESREDEQEVYLSTGETAKRIGVSQQTILNMIQDGRIKAIRPAGTHYKIPASQFVQAEKDIREFERVVESLHSKYADEITEEDLDSI